MTGDSLLTQREVSERIVRRGGDYLLPVKDNQPSLRSDLDRAFSLMGGPRVRLAGCATLDGAGVSPRGGSLVAISEVAARARHGRRESRQLWVMHDPEFNQYAGSSGEWGQPWPSLAQVCRMERRRSPWRRGQAVGEAQVEVSYYITNAGRSRMAVRLVLTGGVR
ncbi:MAG TPA: hypothetical protein VFR55_05075 [Dehalococcoidia bacterium]|nr:hypothetical protein [Dehalococcoidia bacterium]